MTDTLTRYERNSRIVDSSLGINRERVYGKLGVDYVDQFKNNKQEESPHKGRDEDV